MNRITQRDGDAAAPLRRSRPGRTVVVINLLGLVAFLLPLAAAWTPWQQLQRANDETAEATAALRTASAHRVVLVDYSTTNDDALRRVGAGELEGLDQVVARLIDLGSVLRSGHPAVAAEARRLGHATLAERFDERGAAIEDVAERSIRAYNQPGVDTAAVRAEVRAADDAALESTTAIVRALEEDVASAVDEAGRAMDRVVQHALVATAVAGVAMSAVTIAFRQRLVAEQRAHEAVQRVRDEDAGRTAFEMKLRTGLDMASSEDDAHDAVARSLALVGPHLRAELMLSDSSRTHFEVVAGHEVPGCAGCSVVAPNDCPAVRHGHLLTFESSESLDACPHLRGRPQGPVGAVCIPMSIGSQTAGVLHVATPHEQLPPPETVMLYETAARVSSDRLGMLRAMARSEAQAATDPLTGLLNRRSLDDRAQQLLRQKVPFTVAFGDLDHFKLLNDLHGHETGDRALRLFSRILAMETRPDDIVSRYGGEEFLLVLPQCDALCALDVLARVRSRLAEEIPRSNLPQFTSSFGVAAWDGESDLQAVISVADAALLAAKAAGRDRDVVADEVEHDLADLPTV